MSELVSRDMKLLYKRSTLGVAWTLIRPLLQLCVFTFVFQGLLSIKIPNYAPFLFIGILAWGWFQSSLTESAAVIVGARSLIGQPNFPSAILPSVSVITGLIHFLLAFPVCLVFLAIEGITPTVAVFWLPVVMLLQFMLIISLGYFLAALNVTFRDTQHSLAVILQLLLYMSGIFYNVSRLEAEYQRILYFNPMSNIIIAYRAILIEGIQPDWPPLLVGGLVSFALLPLGRYYFRRQSGRFMEAL